VNVFHKPTELINLTVCDLLLHLSSLYAQKRGLTGHHVHSNASNRYAQCFFRIFPSRLLNRYHRIKHQCSGALCLITWDADRSSFAVSSFSPLHASGWHSSLWQIFGC
jgi:hypothetical protein